MTDQPRLQDALGTFHVGSPTLTTAARISELRAVGLSDYTIARRLNAEGVPTPSGRGRWHGETLQRFMDRPRWNAYMRAYKARRRMG